MEPVGNSPQRSATLITTTKVMFSFLANSAIFIHLLLPLVASTNYHIDGLQGNYLVRSVLFESPKDNSAFTQGDFCWISGVTISPITGQVYFADWDKNQIFKFYENGEVELVAGTGEAGHVDGDSLKAKFNSPQGLTFHPNGGFLAVADSFNHIICIISVSDGKVLTLAGKSGDSPGEQGNMDGVGLNATFNYPNGLTFDSMGNVLVANQFNHLIRKIELSSGRVTTIAGNGNPGWNGEEGLARSVSLNNPLDICFDPSDNSFYFTDSDNKAIRRVNSSGYLTTVFRNETVLSFPLGIVKLETHLFVSDGVSSHITRIDLKSREARIWAGNSVGLKGFFDGSLEAALFQIPTFLALDPLNSTFLLVTDVKAI